VQRGWIGIHVQPVTADIAAALNLASVSGSIITRIDADSPAVRAQLGAGDIILKLDGNDMAGPRELNRKIASLANGEVAHFALWRAGTSLTSSVTVGTLPSDSAAPRVPAGPHIDRGDLGLTLAPLTDDARNRLGIDVHQSGVLVEDVAANSIAWERGITSGSAILMVDRRPVTAPEDVVGAIESAERSHRPFVLVLVAGVHGLHWRPLPLKQN
jgi:serine protease Do